MNRLMNLRWPENIIKTINLLIMIKFHHSPHEKKLVCKFKGKLDTNVCIQVAVQITDKITEIKDPAELIHSGFIVFDLEEVNYIASSFIRICISTAKTAEKGNFSITNSNPFIKKTFKIAGLDEMLNVR